MGFNMFKRAAKPKVEIPRIDIAEYGEPKYVFTHIPTLEVYREYNDTVSAPAIERDKKLKKVFELLLHARLSATRHGTEAKASLNRATSMQ